MLLWPVEWPSPNRAGSFVPRAFLTRSWSNQQGGIRLPIEGGVVPAACWVWLRTTHGRAPVTHQDPEPRFVGTDPNSSSSPSSQPHKALFFSAFCSGLFHLAWAVPGTLSSYLGARCLCVHSLRFVRSTYNMSPTSISEMQWMPVFLSRWTEPK